MASVFIDIECDDDPVVMEVTDNKEVIFHGYDHEPEAAMMALGLKDMGGASFCYYIQRHAKNRRLDEALVFFATNGYLYETRAMIQAGANVHEDAEYSLKWAVEGGWVKIVEALLDAGADPHHNDNEAITRAVEMLDDDMIRVFRGRIPQRKWPYNLQTYRLED